MKLGQLRSASGDGLREEFQRDGLIEREVVRAVHLTHTALAKKRHQTVRVKGAGKSVSFRTTDIDETIGQTHGQTVMPTLTASLWSIPEGKTGESKLSITFNGDKQRAAKVKRIRRKAAETADGEAKTRLAALLDRWVTRTGLDELRLRRCAKVLRIVDAPEERDLLAKIEKVLP